PRSAFGWRYTIGEAVPMAGEAATGHAGRPCRFEAMAANLCSANLRSDVRAVCPMSPARKASGIMYLGIDLGTSAVKTVLVDDAQRVVASRSRSLTVNAPRPGHCEQDPAQWIEAMFATLDALKADHARELADGAGIGLSGR